MNEHETFITKISMMSGEVGKTFLWLAILHILYTNLSVFSWWLKEHRALLYKYVIKVIIVNNVIQIKAHCF